MWHIMQCEGEINITTMFAGLVLQTTAVDEDPHVLEIAVKKREAIAESSRRGGGKQVVQAEMKKFNAQNSLVSSRAILVAKSCIITQKVWHLSDKNTCGCVENK